MNIELVTTHVNGKLITDLIKGSLIKSDESASLVKLLVLESGVERGQINWLTVTSTTQYQAFVNTGYICENDLSRVSIRLPVSQEQGDKLIFHNRGLGGFTIYQNDGQRIRVGNQATTLGQQGFIKSSDVGDYLELVYIGNYWTCSDINGNLEIL